MSVQAAEDGHDAMQDARAVDIGHALSSIKDQRQRLKQDSGQIQLEQAAQQQAAAPMAINVPAMQVFKEERKDQQVAMNSLADNANWDEMSDCSAEVPEEQEEEMTNNAASYQPKRYNENYHKASKLLQYRQEEQDNNKKR